MCNFIGQASHLPSPPTKEKRNDQPSHALTVQASSSVLYRIVLPSASQHPSPPYSGRIPWSFLLLVPGPQVDEQALHLLHGTHLQSTAEWIRPHHHEYPQPWWSTLSLSSSPKRFTSLHFWLKAKTNSVFKFRRATSFQKGNLAYRNCNCVRPC